MASSDFLSFASGSGANVLSQADYAALAALATGFSAGVAQSAQVNKVLRQSSIMSAVLAQFIVNNSGQSAVDDGTTATLLANFTGAVRALTRQQVVLADTGAANAYTAVNATPLVAGTWVDGVVQAVKIAHANTGTSTYAPDGLAAIPIYGLGLQPLQGGELALNGTAVLMHATIAGVNSGNPIAVLMECAGGAQQITAATQSQHAVQFGQMQASMLGASAVTLVPTATALTSANAGQLLVFSSGVVGTLPAASSIKSGQGLKFFSIVAGASVARAGTTDTITVGSTNVTSIALNAGDTLTLISNGSNGWYAVDGSAQLGSSAVFGSSIGSLGYQKLPSGLILQWGSANTGASPTAVTFPIAFPNACRSVTLGANYSTSPAGAQITSGPSTTGFSLQLTTFTGTNLPGQSVSWMAIGN